VSRSTGGSRRHCTLALVDPTGGRRFPRRDLVLGALGVVAATAAGLPGPAAATHQPDHRFIVLGYVNGDDGQPVAGAPVVVTRLKTGLDHPVKTEKDGFYVVVVHLHDENEGERLRIRGRGATLEVRARFDVSQKKVERGTRADYRGGVWREDRVRFAETLREFIAR
jgi:hypothetical protein